jgi:hypothetical protein
MENYIGRKCKGFRFESVMNTNTGWVNHMKEYIGEIGTIMSQDQTDVLILFENSYSYFYPISLIEPHLIPESPEIPQLGGGIEMEVSNDDITWCNRNIIAQMQDGWYIINDGTICKYARPIHKVKKYTKDELVKILGHDFEIV